jgi:ribosomal protein S18 acetylase RimI-like enzyme
VVQAVWESSSRADDPGGYARGGWSVSAWATDARVLVVQQQVLGVAAIRGELSDSGGVPIRVALQVDARRPEFASRLVQAGLDMARSAGARSARAWVPGGAAWMQAAAGQAGFSPVRTIAHMLLPAETATPPAATVQGLTIRPMRAGEEDAVLQALNRNWAGTWEFVAIPADMLLQDLDGQRDGMLLGFVDNGSDIRATCHAVFDPHERNPDGQPRAWISNLTVEAGARGRGIARAMLTAGIAHLRARSAGSITLGVDASDPAPFRLYTSAGFRISSTLEAWDRPLA